MGQISIRLDDKIELKLKQKAKENKQTLAEFCREQITGESRPEELNRFTIESRLEKLEKSQMVIAETNFFLSRVLFYFIDQLDATKAAEAWMKAEAESQRKEG